MPTKLHRHFIITGIGVYLISLLAVSLCFRSYMLKPLWIAWGVGAVLFFFLLSYGMYRRWRHIDARAFLRRTFWVALGIRMAYVGAIIFYYYFQTGVSFEYQAADSWNYHITAGYLAQLAREGDFKEIFLILKYNTMGFSDQGYLLYLTTLYTCFDNNILGPRLLKALMSAYTCVVIYKLASRSLGEKTGRLAAVMAVFLPQFIHYNGTYMKETEMVFLATLALERMDYLIQSKKYTFWNIVFPILLVAMTFGFRTILGMTLIVSFLVFIVCAEKQLLTKKARMTAVAAVVLAGLVIVLTPIGRESYIIARINFDTSNAMVEKYQQRGLKYAEYACPKYMAPGAFVLPLTNMVEAANENQKMMNGTYFVKNYLAFFAMFSLIVAFREKRWRRLSLTGSYTLIYLLIIAFSFAFNSERFHLPAMPGLLIMAALSMTCFRKKDFVFYYSYLVLLMVAIVIWNYVKLVGKGFIF